MTTLQKRPDGGIDRLLIPDLGHHPDGVPAVYLELWAKWHEHIAAQFSYDAQKYTEADARWALNRASEHENYAAQFRRWIEEEKK
jgi:hypothetical protein